jgi:hypothetical protein
VSGLKKQGCRWWQGKDISEVALLLSLVMRQEEEEEATLHTCAGLLACTVLSAMRQK